MNNRTVIILLGFVSSAVFFGIFFTSNTSLIGILIGFITGLFNIQWLSRDANKAIGEDMSIALRIYNKSLFARLGMVTLVVATIGRFRPEWLFYLALGIAVGIIVPLIIVMRQQLGSGRG